MLRSVNPASLRTSLVDHAPSHDAMSDPAGFSSLLRQQTQPSAAPPSPVVQPPVPQPTPRPGTNDAPAPHDASKPPSEAAAAAPAPEHDDTSEPADSADTTTGPRGLAPRSKARHADAAARAAVREAPQAEKTGADAPALPASISTAPAAPPTAAAPSHTAMAEWLGTLQAQRAVPADKSAASAGSADREAADSALETKKTGAPPPGDAPLANVGASPRDHAITDRSDAPSVFAAVLGEHRVVEPIARSEAASVAPLGAAGFPAAPTIERDAPAPVAVTLPTPVDAPDFAQALGVQMSVFAKDGVQHAELHLNPADMGPVSVQIVMEGTQARIDFGADVAATRHAIEAGLPELASALRDAGYTLAGGGVSQHTGSRGQHGGSQSPDGQTRRGSANAASEQSVTRVGQAARRIVSRGGVDLYA